MRRIKGILHFLFYSHLKFFSSFFQSLLQPIHNSSSYGHYEVTELLIKNKADVNAADLWEFTPLHEAAVKRKFEICKLLLQVF
jgi:ankyrin repeat protein